MLLSEVFRTSRTSSVMNHALAGLDTSRIMKTALAGLDTSRLASVALAGMDTSRMASAAFAGMDTSRFASAALAGLDTSRVMSAAFAGLDTSKFVTAAFGGVASNAWFKEFEGLVWQGASALTVISPTHGGLEADEVAQAVSELSARIEPAVLRLRQMASWSRDHNQAIAVWLTMLGTWVAVLLSILALHASASSHSTQITPPAPSSKAKPLMPNPRAKLNGCISPKGVRDKRLAP